MRVISVLPSATEIVDALGHGSELVARSSECDFPSEVRNLPVVMRPRTWDADRPTGEIDERVRRARARNESLYELDLALLRELRPDLLLTQNLCSVCSVTEEEVASACSLAGVSPRVVSLAPTNLSEVWDSVETVGQALGDPVGGKGLARSLRDRTRSPPSTGRTVAVVEWLDPPILAGLWTPDLVVAAGGAPVGPRSSEPGARTTWPELARRSPDLLVVSPCSFSVARSNRELRDDPGLLAAVRSVRPPLGIFVADEAYFSRPGPRLAAGVELIRTLLEGGRPRGPMPVESLSSGPSKGRA
jgi:iron complex transport system substrate-binding protein